MHPLGSVLVGRVDILHLQAIGGLLCIAHVERLSIYLHCMRRSQCQILIGLCSVALWPKVHCTQKELAPT